MENELTLICIFLFAVCPTSIASDGGTSLHSNKTLTRSTSTNEKRTVFRNEYVELGTTVTLNCTSTKISWRDIIFVIWKMNLRNKDCALAVANNDSDHDTCQDGKRQKHTAEGTFQLIIPKFSLQDEGNYTCDISYPSGGLVEKITVSAWVRPHLSGWLESEQGHTVAVCEATGSPGVSIHWETPWNLSSTFIQTSERAGELITVISRLRLPQDASHSKITCVATINGPKHTDTRFSNFTIRDTSVRWPFVLFPLFCVIIALLAGLCIMYNKLTKIRKLCCKPNTQQPTDPEELHTYNTLMPRRISIYDSLFSTEPETHAHTNIYVNTQGHS